MGFQLSIRMEDDLHNKAEKAAKEAGQTLAEWVRRAMREKLEIDEDDKRLRENSDIYFSKKNLESLKYALQLPEIQEIILSIVEKRR